jgi:adenine-specific DNA-methyltransferase
VFNDRARAADALAAVIAGVRARCVVMSASNEGWLSLDELLDMARARGSAEILAFDSRRYIGAQIGIHNLRGERVGRVSHTRNVEYLVVAGERSLVKRLSGLNQGGTSTGHAAAGCRD